MLSQFDSELLHAELEGAEFSALASTFKKSEAAIKSRLHKVRAQIGRSITMRERAILELLGDGYQKSDIAAALEVSAKTLRGHLNEIKAKLGTKNEVHSIATAIRLNLLSIDYDRHSDIMRIRGDQFRPSFAWANQFPK